MSDIKKIDETCCGPGYASPSDAIKAPNEKLLYTIAVSYTHLTMPTILLV